MDQEHLMTRDEWETFNHDNKIFKSLAERRYYCYCGHSVTINDRETRVFCTHCGHWVYKDESKQKENIKNIQLEEQKKQTQKKMEYFRNRMKEVLK